MFFVTYSTMTFFIGSSYGKFLGLIDKQLSDAVTPLDADTLANSGVSSTQIFTELFEKQPQLISVFGGQEVADALTSGDLSVLVWLILNLSSYILPGLILIIGYDRISDDLSSKFSRFIFLRLRRESYLVGKVLAQWLVAMLVFGLVFLVGIILVSQSQYVKIEAVTSSALPIWAGMFFYLLAYVSLTALFSVNFVPAFRSLALGLTVLMAFGFLSVFKNFDQYWLGDQALPLWMGAPSAYFVYLIHICLWFGLAIIRIRTREI